MLRSLSFVAALVLATLPVPGQSAPDFSWPQKTFEEALARYKVCLARKAFLHHWQAREVLGWLGSPEAVPLLVKDYATVKEYAEYSRYTIAEVFGRRFRQPDAVEPLRALRAAHRTPGDAWLWYHTLRNQADTAGTAELVAIATTDKSPVLRAAAILALGDSKSGDVQGVVMPNCVEFPKKESERMVLLGAMTGALFANRSRINADDYRAALTAYIGLLEPAVALSHIAKVQMARHLQIILKSPAPFVNPEAWLDILARGELKQPTKTTTTAQRFFGVETDGERIVYVVDMSDSMLKPIEPSAKPATGPVTGPKEKKKRNAVLDESDLPWHAIKTRWDLARENLRISLSRLTPDKEFCVVWFGAEEGTLDACKGLIKASRGNIDRVMAELDGIKARKDPKDQHEQMPPEGKLRGDTNLHGGLRLAFALHSKGFASTAAYVDPQALAEGCDTILLLSDGDPSVDDFLMEDKNYGEGKTVHSFERGEAAPDQPMTTYPGPFVSQGTTHCPTIVADVRRMNAFRRVRLHAVGLGEANMELMKALAQIGNGEALTVGAKSPDRK
ncbi:MAG: hypothetical protein WAT39_14840 [Planctomycetota bacterium]